MAITLVLIVHTLLAAALVAVILLQRSEGGGLGIGGGNAGGLVSARGAADLMTRSTTIIAALFILTSLGLAMLYGQEGKTRRVDTTATARVLPDAPAPSPSSPVPAPGTTAPFAGGFGAPAPDAPATPGTAPAQTPAPATPVPLAQ